MHPPFRLLLLPVVLVVAACSASPAASTTPSTAPSAQAPEVRPSMSLTTQPGITADYSGILSMDAIEGGCPYLATADGKKLQVLWPDGWKLEKSPLQLVAPDGSVHAKGGDTVSINGAEANDMATICQIGPVIRATEVLPN